MSRLLIILFVAMGVSACRPSPPVTLSETYLLMGTAVVIEVEGRDRDSAMAAIAAAHQEMRRLTAMMSHYEPDSVVSRIAEQAGIAPVAVPVELMQVLQQAQAVALRSQGKFDVTIGALQAWRFDGSQSQPPDEAVLRRQRRLVDYRKLKLDPVANTAYLLQAGMRLDLGAIAKLYIVHAGLQRLQAHGVQRAMINAGGDIAVVAPTDSRPWRIGIRDPRRPDAIMGVIALHQGFVVSSGDYERSYRHQGRRYHHILDPGTAQPSQGVLGVSLVASELTQINGVSAAMMLLGLGQGRAWLIQEKGLEGVIVPAAGEPWVSPGMQALLDSAASE